MAASVDDFNQCEFLVIGRRLLHVEFIKVLKMIMIGLLTNSKWLFLF